MVVRNEADKVPFVLKKDLEGNVLKIRATGRAGGEILGSIQQTNDGVSYLVAGSGVTILSSSNGQITISSTAGSATPTGPAGGDLGGTYPNPTVTGLSIPATQGDIIYFDGLIWTLLPIGADDEILTAQSNLPVWQPSAAAKQFDNKASYIVLDLTSSLDNERVLTSSIGITVSDGGANSFVTIGFKDNILATLSGSRFQGSIHSEGTGTFEQGLTGSLTRLADGRTYLAAGANIVILSESNGQVTIASQFTSSSFADVSASYIVIGLTASLPNERFLTSSTGITVTDGGAGGPITVGFKDNVLATLSGSRFTGNIEVVGTASFNSGLSGSLTRLIDGRSYLVASGSTVITSESNGQVTIFSPTAFPSTDVSASYIVIGLTSSLPNERFLTSSTGITVTDGGANGPVTIGFKDNVIATLSGSRFTGNIEVAGTASFNNGLSGSHTRLVDGTSFIVGSGSTVVTSQSNGQVTIFSPTVFPTTDVSASYIVIGLTSSLPNERFLTSSTGITVTDGGANGPVTIGFKDNVIATLSGSRFSGNIRVDGTGSFQTGISGSLTRLTDGRSYLVAGSGTAVISESNGQITIYSVANAFMSLDVVPAPNIISGSIESVVGSVYLPGTTYQSIRTMLGCTVATDTAYLTIRRFNDGALVTQIGGPAGFRQSQSSTGSVTFIQEGWYDVLLRGDSTSAVAVCNGVQFVGLDSPRQPSIDAVPTPTDTSGTAETTIGSVYVRSGTYLTAVSMLGSQFSYETATLRLRRFTTADIILTLTGSGLLNSVRSTGSVFFPADDWYDITLANSTVTGSAICNGLKIFG